MTMTRVLTNTGTTALLVLCAWTLLAAPGLPANASTWYMPMTDAEPPGGFDQIQMLMTAGHQFASPAIAAFSGLDSAGDPSAEAEQWVQSYISGNRVFAIANGPAEGYELLAFSIWVAGDRQIDRPTFHYQTYLGDALVGDWDMTCTGPGESDWDIAAGTWDVTKPFSPWWPPGDANGDGKVDLSDLGILATNWGRTDATLGPIEADFDISGTVDLSDLGILATNWGTGVAAVPEPATMSLLGLGGLALIRRRGQAK